MSEETSTIVCLTLGVARLGDEGLFGWWRSRGLGEAGRFVLGNSFPRTWRLAALEGAVLSATLRHEEVLARPDALHIFSDGLPARRLALSWLRERKVKGGGDGLLSELSTWSVEKALERLAEWAGMPAPAGEVLGQGRRLGSVSPEEIEDRGRVEQLIRKLAAAYTLDPRELRYPYFDLRSA